MWYMNYQKEVMLMPAVVINHRKREYLTSDLCPDRTGGIFTIWIRNHSLPNQSFFIHYAVYLSFAQYHWQFLDFLFSFIYVFWSFLLFNLRKAKMKQWLVLQILLFMKAQKWPLVYFRSGIIHNKGKYEY